jgi:hypothetical protein
LDNITTLLDAAEKFNSEQKLEDATKANIYELSNANKVRTDSLDFGCEINCNALQFTCIKPIIDRNTALSKDGSSFCFQEAAKRIFAIEEDFRSDEGKGFNKDLIEDIKQLWLGSLIGDYHSLMCCVQILQSKKHLFDQANSN